MRLRPRELHIFPAHPLRFNTEVVSADLRRKWGVGGGGWGFWLCGGVWERVLKLASMNTEHTLFTTCFKNWWITVHAVKCLISWWYLNRLGLLKDNQFPYNKLCYSLIPYDLFFSPLICIYFLQACSTCSNSLLIKYRVSLEMCKYS